MINLSIQDIKEKIEKVTQDLANESGRKYEVLMEYKSYLEDELEMLKRESNK